MVGQLGVTLALRSRKTLEGRPTDNLEAYQAYMKAKEILARSKKDGPVKYFGNDGLDGEALNDLVGKEGVDLVWIEGHHDVGEPGKPG